MDKLTKRGHKTVIRTEVKFIICQASVVKNTKMWYDYNIEQII